MWIGNRNHSTPVAYLPLFRFFLLAHLVQEKPCHSPDCKIRDQVAVVFIFLRFYYYCQTLEEISKEMEIPLSTVKTRLRRGRHKLKDKLTQYIT